MSQDTQDLAMVVMVTIRIIPPWLPCFLRGCRKPCGILISNCCGGAWLPQVVFGIRFIMIHLYLLYFLCKGQSAGNLCVLRLEVDYLSSLLTSFTKILINESNMSFLVMVFVCSCELLVPCAARTIVWQF